MSPNVGNFVHDLVEMAKAMETLPQVQLELDHAKLDQHNLSVEIDRLKADLEQSRNYAASLEQKVRSLEVERDDASFRVLEAEDREHVILNETRGLQTIVAGIIATLDPPKPEPVKEQEPVIHEGASAFMKAQAESYQPQAQPVATPAEGSQSESPPTIHPDAAFALDTSIHSTTDAKETGAASIGDASMAQSSGQSESSPTVSSEIGKSQSAINGETHSEQGSGASTTDAASVVDPGPALGPYFGKRYRDVSGYISLSDWLAGGGTENDYFYSRP